MPTIVGILTIVNKAHKISEGLKAKIKSVFLSYFSSYEWLKVQAQLS